MEINITIIIQALIFLMLFICLSNILFKPLKYLSESRFNLINIEKQKILRLQENIIKQEYYIKKNIFLLENKTKKKI
jgi:F0F1-type ATP synthase membrane subunit b/b'